MLKTRKNVKKESDYLCSIKSSKYDAHSENIEELECAVVHLMQLKSLTKPNDKNVISSITSLFNPLWSK